MALFAPPYMTVLDEDGNPVSGAKMFFYASETTTPVSIYADSDLTTPLSNPVIADSAGRHSPVYLDSAVTYRCKVTNAANSTIKDIDPVDVIGPSDLAASSGSAAIGFLQSGTGSIARTAQSKMRDILSTADKGGALLAQLDGVAIDLETGGTAHIPNGTQSLSAGFTFAGDRINLQGAGRLATIIQYDPASPGAAITINKPGLGGSFQGSVKGMGFYSANSTAKTAIDMYNQANYEISDISISDGGWPGDSIAIRTRGRQSLHLHGCELATARPVVFSPNATHATISVDHYLCEHLELIGTSATRPCVEFEDGVVLSNFTLRNTALVQGKDGVLWEDTTSTGASYAVMFENIRTEQGLDSAAWSFRLGSTAQVLTSITFRNIYCEPGRNGIRLRNARQIELDNVVFTQLTGTALDITFVAGTVLTMRNCTFQNGAAITLANAKRVFTCRLGPPNSQRGAFEVWVYDDGLADQSLGANVSNATYTSDDITLADGATVKLATNGFTGRIDFDSSVGTGATFYLAGGNNVVSKRDDPYSQYAAVQGSVGYSNVYWDGTAGGYMLENLTGTSMSYTLFRRGRAV